jgi:hypothetical protein
MRYPKNFNKMSIVEQEIWLVKKLSELYSEENSIKKALAKVRGGNKYEVKEIERLDELELKS